MNRLTDCIQARRGYYSAIAMLLVLIILILNWVTLPVTNNINQFHRHLKKSQSWKVDVSKSDSHWTYCVAEDNPVGESWDIALPRKEGHPNAAAIVALDGKRLVLIEKTTGPRHGGPTLRICAPSGLIATYTLDDLTWLPLRTYSWNKHESGTTEYHWIESIRFMGDTMLIETTGLRNCMIELHDGRIAARPINTKIVTRWLCLIALGWLPILVFGIQSWNTVVSIKTWFRQRLLYRRGMCHQCGYCLLCLTSSRCPECGTVIPEEQRARLGLATVPKDA